MSNYNLDALGWYQFERLVQTLLKAHLSTAIEAWSGRGDFGRDAWYNGKLRFPDRTTLSDGPFLFQMKFVANASAAGASPNGLVMKAVKAEASRIKERSSGRRWIPPRHYIFITNAPLSPELREKVRAALTSSLEGSELTTWGAADLDGLLDDSPRIRTSFPQLLGIRDLNDLLRQAVTSDVVERSQIELALSTDLAKVFVPTRAYYAANALLGDQNFVVLTGPPEVGKTAIARMIALARLTQGWEAYECVEPANMFALHDSSRPQIFVADDAFGSTEYRPSLADAWARDMQRILAAVDRRHWVVFTSRPAPLNEALRVLNFQGSARHFPEPARVTVDASALTRTERALILYRHTKAANLSADLLNFIRAKAPSIVENPQFTPLRAHRLVNDDLPSIGRLPGDQWEAALAQGVERGLREPTRAMQTSFNALPLDHRRALVAMLDASAGNATLGELLQAMERRRSSDTRLSPTDVVRSLDEHFVRIWGPQTMVGKLSSQVVSWVHPSVRDLVIDSLISHEAERLEFLRYAGPEGLALALSSAGGAHGERSLPLLLTPEDWATATERAREVLSGSDRKGIQVLLASFASVVDNTAHTDEFDSDVHGLVGQCLEHLAEYWDQRGAPIPVESLDRYFSASEAFDPVPRSPAITPSWEGAWKCVLALGAADEIVDDSELVDARDWFRLVDILEENEPRFLRRARYPDEYVASLQGVVDVVGYWIGGLEVLDAEEPDDFGNPVEPFAGESDEIEILTAICLVLEEIEARFLGLAVEAARLMDVAETHLTIREARSHRFAELEASREPDADYYASESREGRRLDPPEPTVAEIFADL